MKCLSISIILLIIMTVSGCKPSDPFVHVPISGPTVIGIDLKEFHFSKPFNPTKQVNEACFEYTAEMMRRGKYPSPSDPPKFADGTALLITATLIDNRNERIELNKFTRNNHENYICLVPENYTEWLGISKKNASFVKLLVQSNRTINVSKIEWKTYNAWDFK